MDETVERNTFRLNGLRIVQLKALDTIVEGDDLAKVEEVEQLFRLFSHEYPLTVKLCNNSVHVFPSGSWPAVSTDPFTVMQEQRERKKNR